MNDKPQPPDDFQSKSPQNKSSLNKQMSPLAGAALLGVIAFAYIFYRRHDFVRAALVGCVGFAGAYWVIWAGQYLERRKKKTP
jgi:hypothetical protein